MDKKKTDKQEIDKHLASKEKISGDQHLGSSNAFEETENPLSRDKDNISDEKLDELLGN